MAADSDGCNVTTVFTCEGDLSDPSFPGQLDAVLSKLGGLLGRHLKVRKLEPWNSVRVTLSIPREAALRLRQLANEGSQQLRALGILSVQVEGDQVISLRLAGSVNSEPQEVVLQTAQDGVGSSNSTDASPPCLNPNEILPAPPDTSVPSEKVQFRSPNVVCPPDTIVPKVPAAAASTSNATAPASKAYPGPFPFASMNQAIHSRDNSSASSSFTTPPPPYPGKHPPVTLSSPLLVNLLQNEGGSSGKTNAEGHINGTVLGTTSTVVYNCAATRTSSVGGGGGPSMFAQQQHSLVKSGAIQANASSAVLQQVIRNVSESVVSVNKTVVQQKTLTNADVASSSALTVVKSQLALAHPHHSPSSTSTYSAIKTVPCRTSPTPYRPCPPPYPIRDWDPVSQQLLELTPSLTDLKADDLDHLLPSLERELASSPLDLPEEYTGGDKRNFLINPLTGELELQSSSDGETDEPSDVFTGLPSPSTLSDDDTNSTIRPDTTDQSDSETRSVHSDSGRHSRLKSAKCRDRGRDSPLMKPEKIKLRLKLEKSEPVSPAYKVDVSFVNAQPKKAVPAVQAGEELRVPPLHISLRGRNHVVINSNKKKAKFNADGSPVKAKVRKTADGLKLERKGDVPKEGAANSELLGAVDGNSQLTVKNVTDQKRLKKLKPNYEQPLLVGNHLLDRDSEFSSHNMALYNSHFKEKLKERRGSDSELTRASKKYGESNGRRLSQVDSDLETAVPGSTNTGTVSPLPIHKARKDKLKIKENFKCKKSIKLPTGEIDMAKFEQRLLEETEKGVPRPPHRTNEIVLKANTDQAEKVTELVQTLSENMPLKDKPPEADKCNTPDQVKSATTENSISDKQAGRSPNSGGQGEDSGIESMDALSEKSPNQVIQSPHADIPDSVKQKTQVPDMLDIEAQLAKMEGLNGEDLNENKHNGQTKLDQCCGLTSALQDSLNKGTVTLTTHTSPVLKEQMPQVEVTLVPIKSKPQEENLDPLPIRVTPPLYTYSNPDKSRSSESPGTSDSDNSNSCPPITTAPKGTSLLEQLLIEIPAASDAQAADSPSPATRSVRTRASSKLNSPELESPVVVMKQRTASVSKRRRHESDSSLEEGRKKVRKCSSAEASGADGKVNHHQNNNVKRNNSKVTEESSDSDEPLIEKVRKNNSVNSGSGGIAAKAKLKVAAAVGVVKTAQVNTRRSVRTAVPAINTRSKGDKVGQPEADVLRRKTRSAVSEGESKRRKDIK